MRVRNINKRKQEMKTRRQRRIRSRVRGTAEQPRLSVARSLTHVRAQIVDDAAGRTLASATDLELTKAQRTEAGERVAKVAAAYAVGKLLGERAAKAGIKRVVLDRGGRAYHGRVQALAEGARDGGLIF